MKTRGIHLDRHARRLAPLLAALALILPAAGAAKTKPRETVTVFAAASLAEAFGEIGAAFEAAHPGVAVRFNFAGSQQLAAQLEQGAAADVFASADQRWMDYVSARSLIDGDPVVFARNRIVAIVPRTNPGRIGRLQDFARPGLKIVIGAEAVPVGAYTRQVLANLSRAPGFEADFVRRVLANVVSYEENVRGVLAKVQLGEADGGFVYRSDVTSALERVIRPLPIADSLNVIAAYPVAVLRGAPKGKLARDFIARLGSPEGRATLERHGLLSP